MNLVLCAKKWSSFLKVQPVLKRGSMKAVLDSPLSAYAVDRIDGAINVADKYVEKYLPSEDQIDCKFTFGVIHRENVHIHIDEHVLVNLLSDNKLIPSYTTKSFRQTKFLLPTYLECFIGYHFVLAVCTKVLLSIQLNLRNIRRNALN